MSTEAAMRLNEDDPDSIHATLKTLSYDISSWREAVEPYWSRDNLSALELAANRAGWRSVLAPIVYNAEIELAHEVERRIQAGEPLAPAEHQNVSDFDTILRKYGVFSGRSLAFLRAISVLSHAAMERTLAATKTNNSMNRIGRLSVAFAHMDAKVLSHFQGIGSYFPERDQATDRLREFSVTANVTALNIIAPAAGYARLWTPDPNRSIGVGMLDHLEELARPQDTTTALHVRHLPNYNDSFKPPRPNPFAVSPEQIAIGGIWRLPSLQKQWTYKHWCPANISFNLADTAATMRMRTAIKLADGILWESSDHTIVCEDVRMEI